MQNNLTSDKSAKISAKLLELLASGKSLNEAFAALGVSFEKLAGEIYDALNAQKKTIKAGTTLTARSIGDHDCILSAEILTRKGSFVTVKTQNTERRVKINTDSEGNEFVYAMGKYSMCPIFRAV